jgi:prepilin-type processing-associated H-X9-DG protein
VLGWGVTGISGTNPERSMGYVSYCWPTWDYTSTPAKNEMASYSSIVNDRISLKNAAQRMYMSDLGIVNLNPKDASFSYEMITPAAHRSGSKTEGWNVLYLDGHVKFITEAMLRNQIAPLTGKTPLYYAQTENLTKSGGPTASYWTTFASACNALY